MLVVENRLKCIEFVSYPTLAQTPGADLCNIILDDGLLVWPTFEINIPLDEVLYETFKNAWASDCEWLPIDMNLSADQQPVIQALAPWPGEPSIPESELYKAGRWPPELSDRL